jgi:predicted SAM-dependent methyltransferase
MTIEIQNIGSALQKYPAAYNAARFAYLGACIPQARARRPYQIRKYLRNAEDFTGLQIGAGTHQLPGWLKTDLYPNWAAVYLDATKRFPFADATFDYVVAEHIIEHISHESAQRMLQECHRVLKEGGVLRVSTPNIELTHRLMHSPLTSELQRYVSWSNHMYGGPDNLDSPIHVVNRLQHEWGHQFLYDENTLTVSFRKAGFIQVDRCSPRKSVHWPLVNIDSHGEVIGEEFNELESLILEAIK